MKHSLFVLWVALTLAAAVGCGARKPVVSGLVTLDGQPLDNGTIQFFPVEGDGQTSAAIIEKDGSYRTEASPTKMKVVIHSNRVVGRRKMYDDQPDSPMVDIVEEVLPARYSDMNKTELTITVVPGDNQADFDLKSDRKK
jgi:hypothetical protein